MPKTALLVVPMAAQTGYGNDGFSLARALTEAGVDVRLEPTIVRPPIPMPVAMLMTKPLDVEFDYLIHHVWPGGLGLTEGQKRMTNTKKIAWSMWEFTKLPFDTEDIGNVTERLEGYDTLLVYDECSAEAFGPHAEAAGVEMKILQGGIWSKEWEVDIRERDWTGPFRFCMVGALGARKNPFAAIHAFEEVCKEFPDTELHLKTIVRTLHPAMEQRWPGLRIHYDVWDQKRLKEFYMQCHAYVAPSWGEGKNLPALESQITGIPAIYSDFGGHRQWGSSEFGWPVSGTLEEHVQDLPSFRVDHASLVEAMKSAVRDREATKQKGEKASRLIPAMCDWSVVVRKLLETI
jgi:glycosyltransferase involved in cell wall biosynthesis